jgi:hypothetical protein
MVDLILRPSGLGERHNKPWSLQLRNHSCCGETEYVTLCHVSDEIAKEIVSAGACEWLFGEPDWRKRHEARELERARALREEAEQIERAAIGGNDCA